MGKSRAHKELNRRLREGSMPIPTRVGNHRPYNQPRQTYYPDILGMDFAPRPVSSRKGLDVLGMALALAGLEMPPKRRELSAFGAREMTLDELQAALAAGDDCHGTIVIRSSPDLGGASGARDGGGR